MKNLTKNLALEDILYGDIWGWLAMPERKSSGVFYFRREVNNGKKPRVFRGDGTY